MYKTLKHYFSVKFFFISPNEFWPSSAGVYSFGDACIPLDPLRIPDPRAGLTRFRPISGTGSGI